MKTNIYLSKILIAAGLILPTLAKSQTIATGNWHSLVMCSNNTVRSMGNNTEGALGDGTNTSTNTPVTVGALFGVNGLACGLYHSIALKSDGTVWTWGNGYSGQLGNNTYGLSNTPVQVSSVSTAVGVAGGGVHTLILLSDGTVRAAGYNNYGQLGNGSTAISPTVVTVSGLSNVIAVSGGRDYSMALKNDGTVWTWGRNNFGQLGIGSTITQTAVPVQIPSLTNVVAISGGGYHCLALKSDGTVWGWGLNSYGALGTGNTTATNSPVQMGTVTGVQTIAAGGYFSSVLKSDGTIWTCGLNSVGQLGIGTTTGTTPNTTPVQAGITGGIYLAAGWQHALVQKSDGTLWGFGGNFNGQLGIGTNTDSPTPAQVTSLCALTGINENLPRANFSVYPNPSNGLITILSENNSNANIEVINLLGQTVHCGDLSSENQILDLQHLSNGIYNVRISENGKTSTTKLIIQK